MSRPLRIEIPNAYYHVMNRGAAKQKIFHVDDHYKMFLDLLGEIHNRFQVRIHAYCLMPNHYHILIQTPIANLSSAMRHLDSLYTRRYNVLQDKDGPILRGRFKSIIVDSDSYLLRLSRYIHLNPVAANIVASADSYLWSSYYMYLNVSKRPGWLTTNEILDRFGPRNRLKKYRAFVAAGNDKETSKFYDMVRLLPIFGGELFTKSISEKYLKNKSISPEIAQQKYLVKIPTIESIMRVVARYYKVDRLSLKVVSRKLGNRPRQIAIYLCCKLSQEKYYAIANEFTKITVAGVAKTYQRINKESEGNSGLQKEISFLETELMSYVKT